MGEIVNFPNGNDLSDRGREYAVYRGSAPLFTSERCLEDYLSKVAQDLVMFFSDQVTCTCTKTGESLFDTKKARLIITTIEKWNSRILEVMEEEIKDYG